MDACYYEKEGHRRNYKYKHNLFRVCRPLAPEYPWLSCLALPSSHTYEPSRLI